MSLVKVVLVLSCLFFQVSLSCDLYDTDTAVCAKNLEELCGMNSFPDTVQSLYDSRSCLRKNRDLISKECLNYLELEKPSIIDSCFTEMKSYCGSIAPGGFRIHSCLSAVPGNDLSPNCKDALAYDQQIIEERGTVNEGDSFPVAFWSTWTKYLSQVSKVFLDMQIQFSRMDLSQNLRGSVTYIEMDGNEEEASIFLADDDHVDGSSPSLSNDDENDDDDSENEQKENILASAGASRKVESESIVENERSLKDFLSREIATSDMSLHH